MFLSGKKFWLWQHQEQISECNIKGWHCSFIIFFEPSFLHLRDQPITVKWQSVIIGTENFLPFYWKMVQKIGFNLNWKNNIAIQSFYKLINCKRGCMSWRVTRGMHMSDCMNDMEAPSGQGWKEMWIRTQN